MDSKESRVILAYEDSSTFSTLVSSSGPILNTYSVHSARPRTEQLHIYDTSENLLSAGGLQLRISKKTAYLCKTSSDLLVRSGRISKEVTGNLFHSDFCGNLAHDLKEIIGPRALFCIAGVGFKRTSYQIRDADDKIVCRLTSYMFTPEGPTWIDITGLKGYETEYTLVVDLLRNKGLALSDQPTSLSFLFESMAEPVHYPKSAPAFFHVRPSYSTKKAFKRIAFSLFRSIRSQEEGLIADFDTEFLHDYRVGIRKLRTAFEMFEPILKKSKLNAAVEFLKLAGTYSTPARDLDVLLTQLVPSYDTIDSQFIQYLETLREGYHAQLTSFITSDLYEKRMETIGTLIEKGNQRVFKRTIAKRELNLPRLAHSKLLEAYAQVVASAKSMDKTSTYEAIHTLRKLNKQFRYRLMFVQDLLESSSHELLDSCKRIQDLLGAYTDNHVLTMHLKDYMALNQIEKELEGHPCVDLMKRIESEREQFHVQFNSQADYLIKKPVRKQVKRLLLGAEHE